MSKKNAVFIAVVLSLLITSCGTKNLPTPTATSSATKTPTLTPTITPTFTPLPTPTITFTPTPAPISIDNAKMLVPMQTLEGVPAGWWSHLTFSPDLKKYIAYSDIPSPNTGNMAHVLYDTATGEQISTFFGPATNTHGNAFSPDSKILASIDDYGNLFLWDTATGELIKQLSLNYNGFSSVEFSPDGKVIGIASGNLDKGILVFFDVETGERLKRITCGGWCSEIAFSPDGATVASDLTEVGSKRSIVLWDVNTGEKIYSLSSPFNEQITDIEFSPDGKLVASSSEAGGITLWDAVSGQPISTFDNITRKAGIAIGENGPDAIAFSPDGKLLASGYSRGSIILWDTATTLPVYSMQGKYGFLDDQAIILIKFNANGTLFATSNKQQLATVWGISNFSIPTPTPTKKPSKVLLDVNDSFPAIDAPLSQFKFNQYTITALSLNYTIEVNTEDNTYGCFLVWRIDPSPAMGGALFAGASNVPGKFTIRQPGDYIITVQLARRSKQCEPFTYTLKVTQP